MRLDGVAHQVEQHLLDLHLVGQHQVAARIELEADPDAVLLGADQRQRARLLDQLGEALDPPLALAAAHEIAQAADDLAGAQRLLGGLVERIAHHAGALVGALLEETARALQVVGDRRERLVELVGQRRGHFAHRRQPRDVDELGLQLLQARLGLLALGQVADEAGEEAPVARAHLADGQLHGKGRAVLALADDDAADADDPPLAGASGSAGDSRRGPPGRARASAS